MPSPRNGCRVGLDQRGCVVEWGEGAERLTGYAEQEVLGRRLACFQADAGEEGGPAGWQGEVSRSGWLERRDGTRVRADLTASPLKDQAGRPAGFAVVLRTAAGADDPPVEIEPGETMAALVESAAQGVIGVDAGGRIVQVNPMAERIFGYARAELLGQPVEILTPEGLGDRHRALRAGYSRDPKPRPMGLGVELTGRRKDGSLFPVEIGLSTARTRTGPLTACFVTDITERKRREEAIRFQAGLLDQALEPVFSWRLGGEILTWNRGAERLYGFTREEALGRNSHTLLGSRAAEGIHGIEARLTREGEWRGELAQEARDGRTVQVESVMTLVRGPGEERVVLEANRDITGRKLVEDCLRTALEDAEAGRRLLDAVMEHIPFGIAIADAPGGELRQVSRWGSAWIRRPEGKGAWRFHRPDGTSPAEEPEWPLARAAQGESVREEEWRVERADGTEAPVLSSAGPILNEQGEVTGGVMGWLDISQRKQAEDEVRRFAAELEERVGERTAQLERSNQELEAFSYSVSHDLRAPLRGIDGWSLALLEDCGGQLDERAKGCLDRVRSETRRMGRLIDDLLRLSRLGRAGFEPADVDLSAVVEGIASRLRESDPGRAVEFAIEPGIRAVCDASLMEVVLTNLLDNAVKFTATRGQARVEFGKADKAGETVLFVRDNGVGFDMAHAETLFGVFQRLHSEREFPGAGVGLAMVRRIIARHGGRIWAEAAAGEGATFYFVAGGAR